MRRAEMKLIEEVSLTFPRAFNGGNSADASGIPIEKQSDVRWSERHSCARAHSVSLSTEEMIWCTKITVGVPIVVVVVVVKAKE